MKDWVDAGVRGVIIVILFAGEQAIFNRREITEWAPWVVMIGITAAMQYHYGVGDGRAEARRDLGKE